MLVSFESSSTTFNLFSATGRQKLTYLAAWCFGRPLRTGVIRWNGPRNRIIAQSLSKCPEILALGVAKDFRSRGIGSKLLHAFENLARRQGFSLVGLGVRIQNNGVRNFYEHKGYIDSGQGVYLDSWYTLDGHRNKIWNEDPYIFLTKKL